MMNLVYRVLFFFICLIFISGCKPDTQSIPDDTTQYVKLSGQTMGTYYKLTYSNDNPIEQGSIDSILLVINQEMSTYIEDSYISLFNQAEQSIADIPEHFEKVYDYAEEVYEISGGAFDPTLMPIINYWGFGYTSKQAIKQVDSSRIRALMEHVGFDNLDMQSDRLAKRSPELELDFSAIAKGYAVDVIADFLADNSIKNFLVDIGGESYAEGVNDKQRKWTLGINTPSSEAGYADFMLRLNIDKKGLATSGNYRNFYDVDGEKYGHTIDAKTGYPFKTNLLSSTILANNCMQADALATACMAIGLEKSLELINKVKDAEACFIFGTEDGKMDYIYTDGFKDYILE